MPAMRLPLVRGVGAPRLPIQAECSKRGGFGESCDVAGAVGRRSELRKWRFSDLQVDE
jgi:hypothetical protein